MNVNSFLQPMQPWPGLAPYARTLRLPGSGLSLFIYATEPYPAGPAGNIPLILVHGLADEADTWRHILPSLSTGRRFIALDLPGFGRSEKPDRPYTLPFFHDVLLELLDSLEIPRASLLGHSLGAVIAHWVAMAHPGRVEQLALIGGSLVSRAQKIDLLTLLFLVPGLGEWLYNRLRRDPQAAYRSLERYYHRLEGLPQADREFLFQRVNERVWNDRQRRAFLSTFRNLARWAASEQRSLASALSDLRIPTLAVWGEADRINPLENGRALVEAQPSARLVVVPGAGHNVHQENPAAVLEALRGFF